MATATRQSDSKSARSSGPSPELTLLQGGRITLDQYLESRVEDAIAHLKDLLAAEDLEIVRDVVRGEMRTDPTFVELIRRTTGREPAR